MPKHDTTGIICADRVPIVTLGGAMATKEEANKALKRLGRLFLRALLQHPREKLEAKALEEYVGGR